MDAALLALVEREATGTRDVDVVFDAPTKDWAGRRNVPTIDVYLYDIREDLRRFKQLLEAGEAPTTKGQSRGRQSMLNYD